MKPSLGFLLSGLIVVAALTVAAVFGASALLKEDALHAQAQKMQQASAIAKELQKDALEQLALRSQMLASDRDFVEYVAQSLVPDPARGGAIDKLSITDLLGERRQGYDVAMVLDAQGHFVSQSGVLAGSNERIVQDPLIADAIKGGAPTRGTWLRDGVPYWVVVSPLTQRGALKGLLVAASQVGSPFLQRISGLSDSAVLLMTPTSIVAASSSDEDIALQSLLIAHDAEIVSSARSGGGALFVHDDQRGFHIWVTPVQASGQDLAIVAVNRADGDVRSANGGFLLGSFVLFGAIIAILIMLQWWLTWRPLDEVLDVLDRAAKGDRTLVLRARGSAIVTRISDSFNHVLKINRS